MLTENLDGARDGIECSRTQTGQIPTDAIGIKLIPQEFRLFEAASNGHGAVPMEEATRDG